VTGHPKILITGAAGTVAQQAAQDDERHRFGDPPAAQAP
jgi:hypothetical protein